MLAWTILIGAGVMESVWAIALDRSHGFSNLLPSLAFFVALALSMVGLAFALKTLPLGTAYAVWVGIGASLTAIYGMVFNGDAVSVARIALIAGLIGCVIGLKALESTAS